MTSTSPSTSVPPQAPAPSTSAPPSASGVGVPPVPDLKYLAYFRALSIKFFVFLIQLYDLLKDKAGPLKPGIEAVEGSVKSVLGPIFTRFEFEPDVYFKFADDKIDSVVLSASSKVRPEWKSKGEAAYKFALTIPEKAKVVRSEVQEKGLIATAEAYYAFYLPYVLAYLETVWKFLLSLPLFPKAVDVARPYVLFAAQQYNNLLLKVKKSEIHLLSSITQSLPAIPVEKLKKSE